MTYLGINPKLTQFIDQPPGESGKWMSWHGYPVKVSGGYGPHVLNEIESKTNAYESAVIIVTGQGGKGKTYFALRLAEMLDGRFDVVKQVPFGLSAVFAILSESNPLRRGQVVIVDESQFGMSARDWSNDKQKSLMKHFEAVRSKGWVIFVVCLSEKVIDNIMRNYVVTHKIFLTRKGHARVYKYVVGATGVQYTPIISDDAHFPLPGAEVCEYWSCLACPYSGLQTSRWKNREKWEENGEIVCHSIRAVYERRKKEYLTSKAEEDSESAKPVIKRPEREVLEMMKKHPEKFILTQKKAISYGSVVDFYYDLYGEELNNNRARILAQRLTMNKELMEKIKAQKKASDNV